MSLTTRFLEGVTVNMNWKFYGGFTLFAPMSSKAVTLIDMLGHTVHKWELPYPPALYAELLPNGNLLYGCHLGNGPLADLEGSGGQLLEVDWNGRAVWSHKDPYLHHAFHRMSNGHTMVIRWVTIPERISCKVEGGIPETERDGAMWGDAFQEITQQGEVVWEWLSYEHLDPRTDNICPLCPRDEWGQACSCTVLPNGDILASFKRTHTICIIDKTTGDIRWRWGRGELCHQSWTTILENGHILVFDGGMHGNGVRYPYSRVVEVDVATNTMVWEYSDKDNANVCFLSEFMSNCERLPNGNTLICEASMGRIFEVTEDGQIVWEFINPVRSGDPLYGCNNIVPCAFRYGPEYEGLPSQLIALREFRSVASKKRHIPGEQRVRVESRLKALGY